MTVGEQRRRPKAVLLKEKRGKGKREREGNELKLEDKRYELQYTHFTLSHRLKSRVKCGLPDTRALSLTLSRVAVQKIFNYKRRKALTRLSRGLTAAALNDNWLVFSIHVTRHDRHGRPSGHGWNILSISPPSTFYTRSLSLSHLSLFHFTNKASQSCRGVLTSLALMPLPSHFLTSIVWLALWRHGRHLDNGELFLHYNFFSFPCISLGDVYCFRFFSMLLFMFLLSINSKYLKLLCSLEQINLVYNVPIDSFSIQ